MPKKILFVDCKPDTAKAWGSSAQASQFETVPFEPFTNFPNLMSSVEKNGPEIVVIARDLGGYNGLHERYNLRKHGFEGHLIMLNAGCSPADLHKILLELPVNAPSTKTPQPLSAPSEKTLPEATIESDGWVRCPNFDKDGDACTNWRNVQGEAGIYACGLCSKSFKAVKHRITKQAVNYCGDAISECGQILYAGAVWTASEVECTNCHRLYTITAYHRTH